MEKDNIKSYLQKNILLINDIAGYGKVATAAMLPILSYMGFTTYNLPTALVSNTLDYGKFKILDTTDYIQDVFVIWEELGFKFDLISTGFIASEIEAEIIASYCSSQAALGTKIFVDPIMGDEGKLYNGVTKRTIYSMRQMLRVADLIFPNYTEACYLTNTPFLSGGITKEQGVDLVDSLRKIGAKSVVITSVNFAKEHCVIGYNHQMDTYFHLPYTEIPVHFPGTGDIFSAVLIGNILKDLSLEQSTRKAMDAVYTLIDLSRNEKDKNKGILLENNLDIL